MEFKEVAHKRRSTRKFTAQPIAQEVIDSLIEVTLTAPSAKNSRTTQLLIVDSPELIARLAQVRDTGSAFIAGAPLVIVVLCQTTPSDLWRENGAISATLLQLACVDAGLASCWIHVDGRPRCKHEVGGQSATDYLRSFLPIPAESTPLCAIAIGHSDFHPADLPAFDHASKVIYAREK